jgi:hypothetical protein
MYGTGKLPPSETPYRPSDSFPMDDSPGILTNPPTCQLPAIQLVSDPPWPRTADWCDRSITVSDGPRTGPPSLAPLGAKPKTPRVRVYQSNPGVLAGKLCSGFPKGQNSNPPFPQNPHPTLVQLVPMGQLTGPHACSFARANPVVASNANVAAR